jgi:hypothetical protein
VCWLAGEGEGFGQDKGGLQVGGGTEGKTLFAVVTLFGGDLWDKANLFADSSVDKTYGVLLFDLGAVANAEATVNTKGGIFLKAVWIGAVLLSHFLQLGGVRGVSQQEFKEGFAHPVDLLGAGLEDQIFFDRVDAGDEKPGGTRGLCLDKAEATATKGLQFFVVTERGDGNSCALGRLQDGHPFLGFDFFSIDLEKDFIHQFIL